VSPKIPSALAAVLLLAGARTAAAQDTGLPPSPTLPSDTLQANYAPPSAPGPMPELAPALPSDTLDATEPADSVRLGVPDDSVAPMTPDDSAALHDLRSFLRQHPGMELPLPEPPARAVLARV
jgi:hypothetical protein